MNGGGTSTSSGSRARSSSWGTQVVTPGARPSHSTGSGRSAVKKSGLWTKDTRTKRTVETAYTPAEFLATLADHVPDRYRHNVRYFGLLAPRVKCQTHDAVFALLGQERLGKPRRLWWAASLQKSFRVDPLVDRDGQRMHWTRRVPPALTGPKVPVETALAAS